jgi:hypothetical protein
MNLHFCCPVDTASKQNGAKEKKVSARARNSPRVLNSHGKDGKGGKKISPLLDAGAKEMYYFP